MDQVLATAPDDSSRKAGKGLTSPRHWSDLGSTEDLLWGKCQGSGKDPYQVSVDLNGPAFRCTCPSRKFPCKHGLALMLMWAANDGSVTEVGEVAAFAEEWATDRQDKAAKSVAKAEKAAAGETTVDPEAKAKREAKRAELIGAGLEEFDRFLIDLVRQGTATARSQPYGYWDGVAARLVDAQAPALADRVRHLSSLANADPSSREDQLLQELGFLASVSAAWRRRDGLDDDEAAELRRVLGWARQGDEVLARGLVHGTWFIAGRTQEERGPIITQRTWLWNSESSHWVLQLDTASGGAVPVGHGVGMVLTGTAAHYPGLPPLRLLPVALEARVDESQLPDARTVNDALELVAKTYTGNPWVGPIPLTLGQVSLVRDDSFLLVDASGQYVRLPATAAPWMLLALTGGQPADVFGEWFDDSFNPLSVHASGRVVAL